MHKFIRQLAHVLDQHRQLEKALDATECDRGYFLYDQQQEYEKELAKLEELFKELAIPTGTLIDPTDTYTFR